MHRKWLIIALMNLAVGGLIGALLRFAFVEEVPGLQFMNVLHAHSHVNMLGWIYMALYALFIHNFLPEKEKNSRFYQNLFWLTEFSVIGMLISFPIQGYAGWSITFSTFHIVFSYVFVYRFLKDMRKSHSNEKLSVKFVRLALFFMVLSTLALWTLGMISSMGYRGSQAYYNSIQFFLHFQFNGWFLFGLLGLFFKAIEGNNGITFPGKKQAQTFFRLLIVSCFLTFALALAWSNPHPAIFAVNSAGVLIQLAAFIFFILFVRKCWPTIENNFQGWIRILLLLAFACFLLKILIQTAVVIPYIAQVGYTIRNFVIGFIHLILLGVATNFIFAESIQARLLHINNKVSKIGIGTFLTGFVLSESLLFLQGILLWAAMGFLPFYYIMLFSVSVLMPIGIILFVLGNKK